MTPKHLNFFSKVLGATAWTTAVKSGRQLVNPLNRITQLLTGAFSNGFVRVNLTFCYHLATIYRAQGIPGVVKRLKVMQVLTMQALAGPKHASAQRVGIAIARASSGLPRLIPSLHRKAMCNGNTVLVRYWLTLFGLYRVLEMPGKAKFTTITDPSARQEWVLKEIERFMPEFLDRAPWGYREWRTWRIKPLLLTTSGPNGMRQGTSISGALTTAYQLWREGAHSGTMYSLFLEFFEAWSHDYESRNQAQTFNTAWLNRFRMLGGTAAAARMAATVDLPEETRDARASEEIPWHLRDTTSFRLYGRLCLKPEPAGKVRVFAMVDYLTQMVLHPLHKHIFSLLRRISSDGTFDQTRPIARLAALARRGALPYARSIDLSAATDRFPIEAQIILLSHLFNPSFGRLWARILVDRDYRLRPDKKMIKAGCDLESVYRYGAGQPMGAYSSWAVFALSHHMLVQLAAFRVGHKTWFRDYALLGDDLVICDAKVAPEYLNLARALGVEISAAKSLNSRNGSFEFAKRFILKGVDVSPLAFKEFDVAKRHLPSLINLVRRVGDPKMTIARVMSALGFGYKVLGQLSSKLNKLGGRARGVITALRNPISPLGWANWEDWLQMVTPYAVKPFRHDISCRVTQSLADRYNETLLKMLQGLVPEALKVWYVSPFEDFIKPRDWMVKRSLPVHGGRPGEERPNVPLWETEGIHAYGNLILVPLVREVAKATRETIMRLADPTGLHTLEVRLGSYDWLQKLTRLELKSESWSCAIASLLKHSKDLALIGMLRKLEVWERPAMEASIPKDAQKLKRLFGAIRQVAGRSIQRKPISKQPVKEQSRKRSTRADPQIELVAGRFSNRKVTMDMRRGARRERTNVHRPARHSTL